MDDAESMLDHWNQLKALYKDLVYMIKKKKLDPNGSRLRFISSDYTIEKMNTTQMVEKVTFQKPKIRGMTDFAKRIENVLLNYLNKLEKDNSTRPITIYVLTNGVWETSWASKSDKDHPLERSATAVANAVQRLDKLHAPDTQVGIQFIRFGNDRNGKRRLAYLDAKLKKDRHLTRDICDCEPADGNVWKMMLGSIDPAWDDDPDDDNDNDTEDDTT